MHIEDHKVEGMAFKPAHFTGGVINPEIVILHDTAGRLSPGNSAAYLASQNTAKASVHFVVEIDGHITQLVPVNRRANHAGRSNFNGRESCNEFAIGIEIVNPGRMIRLSDTQAQAWWGEQFAINLMGIREVNTREHGHGLWMPYPKAQIEAVIELLSCLFRDVPSLHDITTHWYVSPGRKVDVNPLFPLDQVRTMVLGHDDPAEAEASDASVPFEDGESMATIAAPGDMLNLRRWPSLNPNVIGTIPDGAKVPLLRAGVFGGRQWLKVLYGGQEGWIVARYATPAT